MKKIMCFLFTVMFLCGCSFQQDPIVISVYLPKNLEPWVTNGDMETAVQNERIDELNLMLKDLGKDYKVEFYVVDEQEESIPTRKHAEDQMKELQNHHADIALFSSNIPLSNYFASLNDDMEQNQGKTLREEIPDHLFEANKINGNMYYVPKISFPFHQNAVSFQREYYQAHQKDLEAYLQDPLELLQYLVDTYQRKENELLFLRADEKTALQYKYAGIEGTPLYVDRSNKKVINPLEHKDFLKFYQLIVSANLKKLNGRDFTQQDWDEFYDNGKDILSFEGGYINDETGYGNYKTDRVMMTYGGKIPAVTSGFGILETSKHKEEAFDFLCEINTNNDISNLLIYGKDPKKDGSGRVVEDKGFFEGTYFGFLGNDMISLVDRDQKENKKEIVFQNDALSDLKLWVPVCYDLSEIADTADQINAIWKDFDSFTMMYDQPGATFHSMEEAMQLLEKENKELKEAGIDQMINQLQSQLDDEEAS